MALIMKNIGPAKDLKKRILQAIYTDSPVFLVLDQARTVQIRSIVLLNERLSKELGVTCTDVEDGTTVILHLPYVADSVATALILRPKMEGE